MGSLFSVQGQSYQPANWVNDPFCHNPNYSIIGANTASPSFTNNAVQRGTLYINSPIGQTLTLAKPGDTLTFAGQVTLAGEINLDGDMQFRVGLYSQNSSSTDTNWLGYTFGNPAGNGGGASTGLYVRNNPNSGVFASGSAGNATRPDCKLSKYNAGWAVGTYNFSLSVRLTEANTQEVAWNLTGVAPSAYSYSATYNSTNAASAPASFDQVGFMGGAALFNSASAANQISFTNLTVTFGKK